MLKEFIKKFDFNNPDFSTLPSDFPDCDLSGLDFNEIGKFLAIQTTWELSQPEKPKSRSRIWNDQRGYRFLVPWSNAVLLRILIRKFSATLPLDSRKNPYKPLEFRLKTQLDDAGRSVISNIEEGYRRPTTSEYLKFLGYSEASLEEIHGLINQCQQDGFLSSKPGSSLADLGIDLKEWNTWCKNPLNSPRILYFPLKENKGGYRKLEDIPGTVLTYEIFIELINKTDFLLRKLVESLEQKMYRDKMGYKIEHARIKDKLK